MSTDEDAVIPGLDRTSSSIRQRPNPARLRKARGRVPSRRVLTSGGMLLRIVGYFVMLAGFWFFLWAAIKTWIIVGGVDTPHLARVRVVDEQMMLEVRGWPEVVLLVVLAVVIWCVATLTFALGHALYAVRDLAFPNGASDSVSDPSA